MWLERESGGEKAIAPHRFEALPLLVPKQVAGKQLQAGAYRGS